MVQIDLKPDEPLEKALRRFKKRVDREEVIKEYRKRRYFKKPSIERHEQEISRKRKLFKKQLKFNKRFAY